jgi:hypothetical protein
VRCSEFKGGFNGANIVFLSPIVREFSGIRNGKNRETTNLPPYIASFFLRQKAE